MYKVYLFIFLKAIYFFEKAARWSERVLLQVGGGRERPTGLDVRDKMVVIRFLALVRTECTVTRDCSHNLLFAQPGLYADSQSSVWQCVR